MQHGKAVLQFAIAIGCVLFGTATAAPARAQESAVYRALELEDSARWEEAAALYRSELRGLERVHAAFGLERALITLGRGEELAEVLAELVRELPDESLIRSMYVRTLLGLERPSAARAFVHDWIAEQPFEPEAYRQLYALGPITPAEARNIWQRVRTRADSDSARAIADELTEHVFTVGMWGAARDILEERYARERSTETAERLALAAARAGDVERARAVAGEAALGGESAALAWLALYSGELGVARRLLKRADEADAGAILPLAVLSRTTAVQSSAFGSGLLRLVRGDTAEAARAFERAAPSLPAAESLLLAWAARLHAARGEHGSAEQLYDQIARDYPSSPEAPEAVLAQARSHSRVGRSDLAVERLEHLILSYPASALVPVARRNLDAIRGSIPPSR